MTAIANMDLASVDSPVPWHFGDPLREQRQLLDGSARVDLSHLDVIQVSGDDRLKWLHTLTTQEITAGTASAQTLVLSPQGHVQHDLHYVDHGGASWLVIEPGTKDALLAYLRSMIFMSAVEVADVSTHWAVVGAWDWLEAGDHPTWHSPASYLNAGPQLYVEKRPHAWQVSQMLVPRDQLQSYLSAHDRAGTWAWEALRIRAGVARLGCETDHRTIPHEVGWIAPAVHLNKGCYRGQETVSKVHHMGRPPRRLVQLEIDGSDNQLPVVGAPVIHDGQEVGRTTSVTQDFEHGPLALAVVKWSLPHDVNVVVGDIAASQTIIVG